MSNPTLRFKSANGLNFPDTVSCTLSDISKYSKGTIERKNCLFIGNEQLVSNFGGATLEFRTEAKGTEFNSGDILFGNIRPYLKKVWLSDQPGIASPDVLIFIKGKQKRPAQKTAESNPFCMYKSKNF